MTGWLYLLEINPGARIKAGRTTKLGSRLMTHAGSAEFGGGQLTRVYTVACGDIRPAEAAMLAALRREPGSVLAHGREVFRGIPFARAMELADRAARDHQKPAVTSPLPDGLLADCEAAFNGEPAIHLEELRLRLAASWPDSYRNLTILTLGGALRDVGVRTFQLRYDGRNKRGIRLTDLTSLAIQAEAAI